MSVDAKTVKVLREKTGAGMMDCKRALVETDGDLEKAVEALIDTHPDINLNDQTLGYNFNQPFMGGDLSFGYGFDIDDQQSGGYLNWGTDW